MKKIIIGLVAICCLLSVGVEAATVRSNRKRNNDEECFYSPLQDVIRNARSADDLSQLIAKKVNLNEPVECGGNLLQLSIVRGKPDVVKALLENGMNANDLVSLEGFDIPDAPEKIPAILFCAFYAPREDIMQLLISAGGDITQKDSEDHNIMWYLNKNPVLRNTDISDQINQGLLFGKTPSVSHETNNGETPSQPQQPTNQQPINQQPIITKTAQGTVGFSSQPTNSNQPAGQPMIRYPKSAEIVEPNMPVK